MKKDPNQQMLIDLGQRLKMVRVSANMNQHQMATALGISDRALKNYEKGLRDPPSSLAVMVSRTFNIDARWLLLGADGVEPPPFVPREGN